MPTRDDTVNNDRSVKWKHSGKTTNCFDPGKNSEITSSVICPVSIISKCVSYDNYCEIWGLKKYF